jgi:hypothetical protein
MAARARRESSHLVCSAWRGDVAGHGGAQMFGRPAGGSGLGGEALGRPGFLAHRRRGQALRGLQIQALATSRRYPTTATATVRVVSFTS